MASAKMHADEIHIDVSLVTRLIAEQFPQWKSFPLKSIESTGTSNAIYRLGDTMTVRLPRVASSVAQLKKEQLWLPRLAPHLPLAVPVPVAQGVPNDSYPCEWSIYSWIEGENANIASISNLNDAAKTLGRFIATLHQIDPTQGPLAGEHNFFRGVSLIELDNRVRSALRSLRGMIDIQAATTAWETALQVPPWKHRPSWVHGDLHVGNLLARDGQLTAVIDFGGLGVGDPACDMMAAWTYFTSKTRGTFRKEVQVDDATWARGRGWALYFGLVALPYYQTTNPVLAEIARTSIMEVLADTTP
mgnify:CR=1 FL=1